MRSRFGWVGAEIKKTGRDCYKMNRVELPPTKRCGGRVGGVDRLKICCMESVRLDSGRISSVQNARLWLGTGAYQQA